jgi:transcriptional regulator with GAF, ATPase, and Fis domain
VTDEAMRGRVRDNIVAALDAAAWRVAGKDGAAERLGIRPSTLADRMRSMSIKRPG